MIDTIDNRTKELVETNDELEQTIINLKDKTSIADFMIVASGNSSRHIQALSEILIDKLKDQSLYSHVTLRKGERSDLANLANELL